MANARGRFAAAHAQRGQTGARRDEHSIAAAHRSKKVPLRQRPQAIWSCSAGTSAGLSPRPPDRWRCTDWRPPPSGWLWRPQRQPGSPVRPPGRRGLEISSGDVQALSMSSAAATLRPAATVRVFDIEIPPCRRLDRIGSSPAANDFLHSRTDRTTSVACGRGSSNVLRMESVRDLLATRAAVWQVCYCKLTRVGVRTSRGARCGVSQADALWPLDSAGRAAGHHRELCRQLLHRLAGASGSGSGMPGKVRRGPAARFPHAVAGISVGSEGPGRRVVVDRCRARAFGSSTDEGALVRTAVARQAPVVPACTPEAPPRCGGAPIYWPGGSVRWLTEHK